MVGIPVPRTLFSSGRWLRRRARRTCTGGNHDRESVAALAAAQPFPVVRGGRLLGAPDHRRDTHRAAHFTQGGRGCSAMVFSTVVLRSSSPQGFRSSGPGLCAGLSRRVSAASPFHPTDPDSSKQPILEMLGSAQAALLGSLVSGETHLMQSWHWWVEAHCAASPKFASKIGLLLTHSQTTLPPTPVLARITRMLGGGPHGNSQPLNPVT